MKNVVDASVQNTFWMNFETKHVYMGIMYDIPITNYTS